MEIRVKSTVDVKNYLYDLIPKSDCGSEASALQEVLHRMTSRRKFFIFQLITCSRDDKPYCADCFGELFSKRCTASKPITGKLKNVVFARLVKHDKKL